MKTKKNSRLAKRISIYLISLLFVGYVSLQFLSPQVFSYSNLPPSGKTGSPGDGGATCTGCHSGTASAQTGWITSNIPASGYVSGNTYTITATATYAGRNKFGFEVSPQNTTGTIIGTIVNTSTQTGILASGYIGHTSSGNTGTGTKTWSFDWTAPAVGTGALTFYGAFNCANGNGSTSGDIIYTSTLAIQEAAAVGTDAGISNIVYPLTQACSTFFTPQVTLSNFGATTLTSVTINYMLDGGVPNTFNWTGSLASNATTTVILPSVTTTVGVHTFDANTSLPNGTTDNNTANDAATQLNFTIVTPSALPFTEGFEGTTFPPVGWTVLDPDVANANNATWARTTTAFSTGTASAKLDIFNANAINGQHDAMVSPPIDLMSITSATLTFDVAYAYYTSPLQFSDTLKVWVSTDCGISYTQVYVKAGDSLKTAPSTTAAFTPTANQWRTETIDLSTYAGNDIIVKFECVSDWENNLYIDNVNVTGIVTGIESNSLNNELVIYPNPSNGQITIANLLNNSTVLVYSQIGKLVKSFAKSNQRQFDLTGLKGGVYFIKIISDKKEIVKKIIITP